MFHIFVSNEKTGMRVQMTGYPMSRQECETMARKITVYAWREIMIEPA